MKTKFLIAGIAAISAFTVLSPSTASAHDHGRSSSSSGGYYVTRVVGYDHCGRPIYRQVWVPTSCGPSYGSSHGGGHSHGGGNSHGGGRGGYIHAPGIDIHFGSPSSGHHHHGR